MTVATTARRATYVGDGAQTAFPWTFPILKAEHLRVLVAGVDLVAGVGYTATGLGIPAGGTVTMTAPPAPGASVVILREVPLTQQLNLRNQGPFLAEVVEAAFDARAMADQQLADESTRSLHLPEDEDGSDLLTTLPHERAHKYLAFDAERRPIAVPGTSQDLAAKAIEVDSMGAIGGDYTADTVAVEAAIAACPPGGTVRFSGGKHYLLRSLPPITKAITIDGCGCAITCDVTDDVSNGSPLFAFRGTKGTQYPLSPFGFMALSVTTATPADAGNLAVGDDVLLESQDITLRWDGAGTAYSQRVEYNRVKSVDPTTGVVELHYQASFDMATTVTIAKITPLIRPVVRNFSSIHEVYSGTPYTGVGQSLSTPNIIDMAWCRDATIEDIEFNGWAVQAVALGEMDGATVRRCRFMSPYTPMSPGVSNGVKAFPGTRNIHVSQCLGRNTRHLVDWVSSLDSGSSFCTANDDATATPSAFMTHGHAARRIYSMNDTVIGRGGWSFGNTSFNADYDLMIINPTFFGDDVFGSGIIVSTGNGVQIVNPNVRCASIGIRIGEGANDIKILGGKITVQEGSASSRFGIYIDGGTMVPPRNITIDSVNIVSEQNTTGINYDVAGLLSIRNCRIQAGLCVYGGNIVAAEDLIIENNHFTAVGDTPPLSCVRLSTADAFAPTKIYVVKNNVFKGSVSTQQLVLMGTHSLQCAGNRFHDTTIDKRVAVTSVNIREITENGGRVEDNGADIDLKTFGNTADAAATDVFMQGAAGQNVALNWSRGAPRWLVRMNATPEDGGDTGSDLEVSARTDSGALIDVPLRIVRAADGDIQLRRTTVTHGRADLAANERFVMRTAAGRRRDFVFASGDTDRWAMRCNDTPESGSDAGAEFRLDAYDDDGNVIDAVMQVFRAVGGQFNIYRQLRTHSGRVVAITRIVSTGGTTGMSASTDFIVVTGTANHTLTMPGIGAGRRISIKNSSTGTVTIEPLTAPVTIDGAATLSLAAGKACVLIGNSTDSDWCAFPSA